MNNIETKDLKLRNSSLLLANKGLDHSLSSLSNKSEDIQELLNDDTETIDTLNTIEQRILSNQIDEDYISELFYKIHFTDSSKPDNQIKNSSELALIYTHAATTLQHHEEPSLCWSAIAQANYYFGMTLGLYNQLENTNQKRASKGGKKAAEPKKITKTTFIELLEKSRPPEGWKSPAKAVDNLVEKLQDLLTAKGITPEKDKNDLISELRNMIVEDKQVKKAFSGAE